MEGILGEAKMRLERGICESIWPNFLKKMNEIMKLSYEEGKTVMDPVQVTKSSASDEFSSCPSAISFFRGRSTDKGALPTPDLNLTYKEDNLGEKEMKFRGNCTHHFRALKCLKGECQD